MGKMEDRLKKVSEDVDRIRLENYPKATPGTPDANNPAPPLAPGSPPVVAIPSPQPQLQPQPQPQPSPQPQPPPQPSPEPDWKHKFEVLEGKYKKEIADAQTMVAKAMNEIAEMKIRMSATSTPPPPPPPEAPLYDAAKIPTFKGQYPDMYSDGFVDAVRAAVEPMLSSMINKAVEPFRGVSEKANKVDEIEKRVAQRENNDFQTELKRLVPDWEELNVRDDFKNWAFNSREKFTGATYAQLVQVAASRGDVNSVAEVFNLFKSIIGQGVAANPPPPQPGPPQVANTVNVAPPRPGQGYSPNAPSQVQNQPRLFTRDEVRAFYQDIVKGVYRGREAEQKAMELEINRASLEGRIQV